MPEVNSNWQDEIFQQGLFNNANIAFTGGSEKSTYAITGGLFDQKGTIINSKFKRAAGIFYSTPKTSGGSLNGTLLSISVLIKTRY